MSILPQYQNKNCKVLMQKRDLATIQKQIPEHVQIIITVKY